MEYNESNKRYHMYIRHTKTEDIDTLLELYAAARRFMVEHGNASQWGNGYPSLQQLESDISKDASFVCIDETGESGILTENGIVGTFAYFYGDDPDPNYIKIYDGKWPDHKPYGVVHRITTLQGTHGVAIFCLNWAYEQCGHLRIDTHRNNRPMQNLVRKCGFQYCGVVKMLNGDGTMRDAFMKL